MSVCPGHSITNYLGIVDVYFTRVIRLVGVEEDQVAKLIEDLIQEAKEITKSKV